MKLVILDREGVLNQPVDGYVLKPPDWEPLPGALEAVARLHHSGFRVAVATNQAAVSRGLLDMTMLNAIHQRMNRLAEAAGGAIDAIAICPHSPEQHCDCRKPQPGMLLELMQRFGADPKETVMIGDMSPDIQAGLAAGCRTWLVRSGHGQSTIDAGEVPPSVQVADDLSAVVQRLLSPAGDGRADSDGHGRA